MEYENKAKVGKHCFLYCSDFIGCFLDGSIDIGFVKFV